MSSVFHKSAFCTKVFIVMVCWNVGQYLLGEQDLHENIFDKVWMVKQSRTESVTLALTVKALKWVISHDIFDHICIYNIDDHKWSQISILQSERVPHRASSLLTITDSVICLVCVCQASEELFMDNSRNSLTHCGHTETSSVWIILLHPNEPECHC